MTRRTIQRMFARTTKLVVQQRRRSSRNQKHRALRSKVTILIEIFSHGMYSVIMLRTFCVLFLPFYIRVSQRVSENSLAMYHL